MDDGAIIERKLAQSGNVSYAEPVVIHETTEKTTKFVPYSVARSAGHEFNAKIECHLRSKLAPTSISFNSDDLRKLYAALAQYQAVMTDDSDGTFISFRIKDGQLSGAEPESLFAGVMALLATPSMIRQISERPGSLTDSLRSAMRIAELRSALGELRAYLDNDENREHIYQAWIERHSWVFGAEYLEMDKVRSIAARDNVDVIVARATNGFRELVELKIPGMKVLNYDQKHRNYYFSAEVSEAIGQVARYLEKFAEYAANGLDDFPNVIAFHPVATIVIGRSNEWSRDQHRALHSLNAHLRDIQIITFDYLLRRGERLLEIIQSPAKDEVIV
jgi:hypothetical protein